MSQVSSLELDEIFSTMFTLYLFLLILFRLYVVYFPKKKYFICFFLYIICSNSIGPDFAKPSKQQLFIQ